MVATTPTVTNQSSYTFIVDTAKAWSITATATFTNAQNQQVTSSATMTFTSVAPTASLAVTAQGQAVDHGGVGIWDKQAQNNNADGIELTATTSAAVNNAGKAIPGTFMFMNMVTPNRLFIDQNNNTFHLRSPDGKPVFDNGGAGGTDNTLGMTAYNTPNPKIALTSMDHAWDLPYTYTDPVTKKQEVFTNGSFEATDSPSQDAPNVNPAAKTLSVGSLDGKTPESLTTYLMYKPDVTGRWIALSKVDWSWGGVLTVGNAQLDSSYLGGAGVVGTPTGAGKFPIWTTTSGAVADANFQPGP